MGHANILTCKIAGNMRGSGKHCRKSTSRHTTHTNTMMPCASDKQPAKLLCQNVHLTLGIHTKDNHL